MHWGHLRICQSLYRPIIWVISPLMAAIKFLRELDMCVCAKRSYRARKNQETAIPICSVRAPKNFISMMMGTFSSSLIGIPTLHKIPLRIVRATLKLHPLKKRCQLAKNDHKEKSMWGFFFTKIPFKTCFVLICFLEKHIKY